MFASTCLSNSASDIFCMRGKFIRRYLVSLAWTVWDIMLPFSHTGTVSKHEKMSCSSHSVGEENSLYMYGAIVKAYTEQSYVNGMGAREYTYICACTYMACGCAVLVQLRPRRHDVASFASLQATRMCLDVPSTPCTGLDRILV